MVFGYGGTFGDEQQLNAQNYREQSNDIVEIPIPGNDNAQLLMELDKYQKSLWAKALSGYQTWRAPQFSKSTQNRTRL